MKQLTWFFLPFYLIWIARRVGWRQAIARAAVCSLVFLAINAPFLLSTPAAWASSMLLPISEPAFPGGVGLVTLAQGGWMPLLPTWMYTALEVGAYVGLLAWYSIRQFALEIMSEGRHKAGAWALVLAPLPLLLATRSLISYTMFLPILALAAVLHQTSPQQTTRTQKHSPALQLFKEQGGTRI